MPAVFSIVRRESLLLMRRYYMGIRAACQEEMDGASRREDQSPGNMGRQSVEPRNSSVATSATDNGSFAA